MMGSASCADPFRRCQHTTTSALDPPIVQSSSIPVMHSRECIIAFWGRSCVRGDQSAPRTPQPCATHLGAASCAWISVGARDPYIRS